MHKKENNKFDRDIIKKAKEISESDFLSLSFLFKDKKRLIAINKQSKSPMG